jgi:hypothetical protein
VARLTSKSEKKECSHKDVSEHAGDDPTMNAADMKPVKSKYEEI